MKTKPIAAVVTVLLAWAAFTSARGSASESPAAPAGDEVAVGALGAAPVADNAPTLPTDEDVEPSLDEMFKTIGTQLKRSGERKEDVYIVTVPRDDLDVRIEGMDVPTAAGIASEFRFYQCPCGGKISVIGQFVTADYEANDVVDALRAGHFVVASVGPMLMYEHPRLMVVRFQGEAKANEVTRPILKALEWTGERRMAPLKRED